MVEGIGWPDEGTRRTFLRQLENQVLQETGNQFERIVLLAADGTPLLVQDGSIGDVYLTTQDVERFAVKVDLLSHNHPRGTSFTEDDVLGAIALNVRELNAFDRRIRHRLFLAATGAGWPAPAVALAEIRRIDAEIRVVLRPRVLRGDLTPLAAEALHRRLRWVSFARRFAPDVHYVEERR